MLRATCVNTPIHCSVFHNLLHMLQGAPRLDHVFFSHLCAAKTPYCLAYRNALYTPPSQL